MLLSHDDTGNGDCVALLHAGVCDRRMWATQVAELSALHRVVAPDLRGYGDSPLPGEHYSNAGDVVGLLDSLGLDRVALVGSSFGGRVALEVASRWPSRVSHLVLLCAALPGVEATADAVAFDEAEDALLEAGDIDEAVELNVRTWLGPDADDDARALVRTMQRRAFDVQIAAEHADPPPEQEDADIDLSAVTAATTVVSGDLDLTYFRIIAEHLAAGIAGAELVRLSWAAHLPSLERPAETTALISRALHR